MYHPNFGLSTDCFVISALCLQAGVMSIGFLDVVFMSSGASFTCLNTCDKAQGLKTGQVV